MSRYFRHFPTTEYLERTVVNISRRTKFINEFEDDPYLYLPYTIKNDESAEEVALHYYGDVNLVWMLYLANRMLDPYHDWPLSQRNFYEMLKTKYAEQSGEFGFAIVAWTQNTQIDENVLYYRHRSNDDRISADTYNINLVNNLDPNFVASDWSPIRIFDYEEELNNAKRNIVVINKKYASTIESKMKSLLYGV